MKRNIKSTLQSALLTILIAGGSPAITYAIDVQFFQSNDILYYLPDDAAQCVGSNIGQNAAGNGPNGNKDYKGRTIIPEEQMTKIKEYQPIYEKGEAETGVPWQIFAVLHIRESVLAYFNPANGQGIYQDFEQLGGPYPPDEEMTDEEFLRQTVYAGRIVKQKAGDKFDLVQKGDPNAIKDMFFGYNGRAPVYIDQAIALGFSEEEAQRGEGSPYVMNIADAKRDPEVAKDDGTWGQIKVDLGGMEYPANHDYGAFIMYSALAGIPSSGYGSNTACDGATTGNTIGDFVVYYQDEEPWASVVLGKTSNGEDMTIKGWGCGPTSTAMAISTFRGGDESINPETVSRFFHDSGDLKDDGTHFSVWPKVEKEYNVTITEIGTDMSKAEEALRRGSFVIISADGCPFACAGGHILLLRGMTSSGNFLIADPNKNWGEREDTPWPDSDKTHYEEGFPIPSAAASNIHYMFEIRDGASS